jgi:DNA repair exonuclease SbcCD ATPase subunit
VIKFSAVRWRNFLSTGNIFTEIPLNINSNTLIVGSNGAGKSTLLDALTFSLFGKAFRNINKPSLVNSVNTKDCIVEIEFDTNNKKYKIVRGIKPNIFEIHCDGIILNQDSASRDYQEYLEKFILKMNYKSFTQIVILGSASFTPFMQLKPAERRTVIEDLLDIQIFSVMNVISRQRSQVNREDLEKNRIELTGKEEKKVYIEKTISSLRQNNITKKNEYNTILCEHRKTVSQIEKELVEKEKERDVLLNEASDQASIKDRHKKLVKLQSSIEVNLKNHEDHFQFFDSHDECPTCNQNIDLDFKSDKILETGIKIGEMKEGLRTINIKIQDCINDIGRVDVILIKINTIRNEINSLKSKQSHFVSVMNDIEDKMSNLENSDRLLIDNEKDLFIVATEIELLHKQKEELLNDRKYIDTSLNLLKDGGIKSKIIKQYIPIINKHINKYLSQMGFFVNFNINDQFEETIKSRFRDEFSYDNFSEGEKRKIDLSILLCWRAIAKMKNSVNTNLLILDEVFDSSLDTNSTDSLMSILKTFDINSSVFVISHKGDVLADKFDKTLFFEKFQNFSKLKP